MLDISFSKNIERERRLNGPWNLKISIFWISLHKFFLDTKNYYYKWIRYYKIWNEILLSIYKYQNQINYN